MIPSPLVRLCFSRGQEEQDFPWEPALTLDLSDLSGTNGYLDDAAREEILCRMEALPDGGIHFLDSGNFHYATYLWLTRIREPFWLLVFDHHTDMQPPSFGELLSCGGWIARALMDLPLLQGVTLVGPEENAFMQTDPSLRERVRFFSCESLAASLEEVRGEMERLARLPALYVSLDKDVLRREDAVTDWDQGEMTLECLLSLLSPLREGQLLGFDICGDAKEADGEEAAVNGRTNALLLSALGFFEKGGSDA